MGGVAMNELCQTIISKQQITTDNKILNVLIRKFPVQAVKKLTGRESGAWYVREISSSLKGYELTMQDGNRVFIDIELKGDYILLYKLYIKEKGSGLGTQIIKICKQYIDHIGGVLMVCLVVNEGFFNKFKWLQFDGYQNYQYKSKKLKLQHSLSTNKVS